MILKMRLVCRVLGRCGLCMVVFLLIVVVKVLVDMVKLISRIERGDMGMYMVGWVIVSNGLCLCLICCCVCGLLVLLIKMVVCIMVYWLSMLIWVFFIVGNRLFFKGM